MSRWLHIRDTIKYNIWDFGNNQIHLYIKIPNSPLPIDASSYPWGFEHTLICTTCGCFHASYRFSGQLVFERFFSLYSYVKVQPSIMVLSYSRDHDWWNFNLHYLSMLPHKLHLFWPIGCLKDFFLFIFLCKTFEPPYLPNPTQIFWFKQNRIYFVLPYKQQLFLTIVFL